MADSIAFKILLVDDSEEYRRALVRLLRAEGYEMIEAVSEADGLDKLGTASPDLVLADLRLMDDDNEYDLGGLEVARQANACDIPCIVVTAHPTIETARLAMRRRGGESLAVDYVLKAHGPQALLDAVSAVVKKARETTAEFPGLSIDLERGLVAVGGKKLDLARDQYEFLALLYRKKGAVVSAQEIIQELHEEEEIIPDKNSADRRVERLVARLREKIETDPSNPRYIITVRGRGYRLNLLAFSPLARDLGQ